MGIAVKSYLDEVAGQPDPTSPATREAVRRKGSADWFPHTLDYGGDLDRAFEIWDAVSWSGLEINSTTDRVFRCTPQSRILVI